MLEGTWTSYDYTEDSLPFVPGQLPNKPPQSVRPIYQVEVANIHEGPFVALLAAPHTAVHTDQPIVQAFFTFYDSMRLPEGRPQCRLYSGSIGEISRLKVSDLEILQATHGLPTGHLLYPEFLG